MVSINPKLAQTYQTQVKKVAAQEENNQQQIQQAETKAVKQPAVPTLQPSTVKVPLGTLQANAGIGIAKGVTIQDHILEHYEYDSDDKFLQDCKDRTKFKNGDTITFYINGEKYLGIFTADGDWRLQFSAVCVNDRGKQWFFYYYPEQ